MQAGNDDQEPGGAIMQNVASRTQTSPDETSEYCILKKSKVSPTAI
jgi:hypothetical protein